MTIMTNPRSRSTDSTRCLRHDPAGADEAPRTETTGSVITLIVQRHHLLRRAGSLDDVPFEFTAQLDIVPESPGDLAIARTQRHRPAPPQRPQVVQRGAAVHRVAAALGEAQRSISIAGDRHESSAEAGVHPALDR